MKLKTKKTAKKQAKNRKRIFDPKSKALKKMPGFIVSWQDENPLREEDCVIKGSSGHRRAKLRQFSSSLFTLFQKHLINDRFFWEIKVDSIFEYEDGSRSESNGSFSAYCKMYDITKMATPSIEEAVKENHAGKLLYSKYWIECISLSDVSGKFYCEICDGYGVVQTPNKKYHTCPTCEGSGRRKEWR